MDDEPTTRASLLVRLRDPRDGAAWSRFVEVYGPLLHRYARRRGLQDADAADLTQEILRAIAGAIGRFEYDRHRGKFRGWLFTVTRHALHRFRAGRQRQPRAGDLAIERLLEDQAAPEDPAERSEWDREFDRRLFDWAAGRVRGEFQPSTWEAFWRTAVEHASPRAVADGLGMTIGAVYVAKSRVLTRLRAVIEDVQRE
jgi:RNA polymerase sigma-70 factor (ECF subfamily)